MKQNNMSKSVRYYEDVSNILGKEIEQMIDPQKIKDNGKVLLESDIEILSMAKDFFNEFVKDFENEISKENIQKFHNLNDTILKIIEVQKEKKNIP